MSESFPHTRTRREIFGIEPADFVEVEALERLIDEAFPGYLGPGEGPVSTDDMFTLLLMLIARLQRKVRRLEELTAPAAGN